MNAATEFEGMVENFVDDKVEYDQNELSTHPKRPKEHDPEWSEYLLDQLSDSELINGAPTVDGLRRITEKCFGEIIGSKFLAFGCGSAIASSSVVSEMVKGKKFDDVNITNKEIAAHLKLPPVKLHCSMLAEDAVKAAIEDYKKKN